MRVLSHGMRAATSVETLAVMKRETCAGFSLMELMVVLIVASILFAITLPAFKGFTSSNDLKGSAKNIATQLSLAHERAISTGNQQTMRFMANFGGTSDYHIWANSTAYPSWKLPKGITYFWGSGTQNTYRMTSDGRCLDSGYVILQNDRGDRDTVSVRLSGLVIVY